MSAPTVRLKKEARALFWPWFVVMIAGALPLLRPSDSFLREGIPFVGFIVGIPLLAALSFGNEFHCRTLPLLLSQPAGRMAIWREKLMVAGVAVASAALVFWYVWRSVLQQDPELWLAGLAVMAMTAATPFFTLLARSTTGGLAMNCVPQIAVMVIGAYILGFGNPPPAEARPALSIAAVGYAVVMLWLGGRKLAQFQVTGGAAGGDLFQAGPDVVPEALARWFRYAPAEPFFNLMRKEFRLLRPVWLMGLLFPAYLICLAVLRLLPDLARPAQPTQARDLYFILPFVSIPPLMAILAGCLSLGEERTSGTHSWHLTLPVAASRQWFIKLLMSLFTGLVCAALLPLSVLLSRGRFVDPVSWMSAILLLSMVSFWCACAANGTVRSAIWILPVIIVINEAAAIGVLVGQELAKITGTLRDFVVSWFQLSPSAFTGYQFTGETLLDPRVFVPVVLLAMIQSYRLFRTQPQDSIPWMIRCLLPLVMMAFLCGFAVNAGWVARWGPFRETMEAIDKLHSGGAAAQLTGDDLAKVSPLSTSTRRWLRGSRISVTPDPAHSGYFATIHLASGLDCRLTVRHFGGLAGTTLGWETCAPKGP